MEKHRNFFKDQYGMEANFIHLDISGDILSQIKRSRVLKLISVSLYTLNFILSFQLLINLLFLGVFPANNQMSTMISCWLAVNLTASLILYKYRSTLEKLKYHLGIKAGSLDNLIKDFDSQRGKNRHHSDNLRLPLLL
jgi:hypothetical protein